MYNITHLINKISVPCLVYYIHNLGNFFLLLHNGPVIVAYLLFHLLYLALKLIFMLLIVLDDLVGLGNKDSIFLFEGGDFFVEKLVME